MFYCSAPCHVASWQCLLLLCLHNYPEFAAKRRQATRGLGGMSLHPFNRRRLSTPSSSRVSGHHSAGGPTPYALAISFTQWAAFYFGSALPVATLFPCHRRCSKGGVHSYVWQFCCNIHDLEGHIFVELERGWGEAYFFAPFQCKSTRGFCSFGCEAGFGSS